MFYTPKRKTRATILIQTHQLLAPRENERERKRVSCNLVNDLYKIV